MKALFLSSLGRKSEAEEQIKETLKKNMMNFTCWHVKGMIARSNKDWKGAVSAYKCASNLNKESEGCLRDLANLQFHIRDYPGLLESTRKLIIMAAASNSNAN